MEASLQLKAPKIAAVLGAIGVFKKFAHLNNSERVGKIKIPILYIHGDADEVAPVAMSEELMARSTECKSKELVIIKGGFHQGLWLFNDLYYP